MIVIRPFDPRCKTALDTFHRQFGYRLEDVLPEQHWFVGTFDGEPSVCITASGFRALAALSTVTPAALDDVLAVMAHHGWYGIPAHWALPAPKTKPPIAKRPTSKRRKPKHRRKRP